VAELVELVVTKRAEEDFRAIWRSIARHDENAADRLLLRIDEQMQLLRRFPEMYVARDDIRPGLRMMVEGNYLVLYEYHRPEALIEIIAVVDGRRDLFELF
jgi:toxin ParE1/3/4